ncbi:MAG: tRNA pseudouridine(38-40) synthase TruA [Bacteroidales bacterium]|nr:tRNA pseudouridine(38-40) synthase TruA [Bacteroidales bacterium]
MNRYFIELSFKGTRYHGWQLQPNAESVQAVIDNALSMLLHEPVETTGAGRTDAGVHALFFTAHFDTSQCINDYKHFVYKMNALLPRDMVIHEVYPVKPDSHARYSAVSRTYTYRVCRTRDPFIDELSWSYSGVLDIDLMNKACEMLLKTSDFTSFSKLHTDVKNNICILTEAVWNENGNQLVFTITGNRFLRNMVRAIVGTLVDLGRGRISLEKFVEIIDGKDRRMAGFSAPAQGLMLTGISYPADIRLT